MSRGSEEICSRRPVGEVRRVLFRNISALRFLYGLSFWLALY